MDVLGEFLTLITIGVFIAIGFEFSDGSKLVQTIASRFRKVENFNNDESVLFDSENGLFTVKIIRRLSKYSYLVSYKNHYECIVYKRVYGYKLLRK